jgi:hypothetical protein
VTISFLDAEIRDLPTILPGLLYKYGELTIYDADA